MIPDLGKYAVYVLASYGVTLGLLAALTLLSIAQARRMRARLAAYEAGRSATETPGARSSRPAAQEVTDG